MASPSDHPAASFLIARREWLLALGALVGLIAALVSVVAPTERALNFGSVVAYVNGGTILRADYERALALLQTDRKSELSPKEKQQVLDRLVEEELLVQEARDLGLTESDPNIRKMLIRAMLDTIATQGRPQASESELRSYFAANADLFEAAPLIHVERITVNAAAPDAAERLQSIAAALAAGESFDAVKRKWSDAETIPLPAGPIPAAKLRDYVGGAVVETVLALKEGETSSSISTGNATQIFHVVSRVAEPPSYEAVAESVASRYARDQDEQALRDYLQHLKTRAVIDIAPGAAQ